MTSPPKPALSALIDAHPKHVKLIGELAIEFNSIDLIFGWFFCFVTNTDTNLAHVIFHTPKAYYTRVEMLENAIGSQFTKNSAPYKKAKGFAARYRKIVDKRHRLIHDTWGTDDGGNPMRRTLPYLIKHEATPADEKDLARLLEDIRGLAKEVYDVMPRWAIISEEPTQRTSWHERS